MAIVWNLKKWLAVNRDIYRASEVQLLLAEKAGVRLSLQAISAIINEQPSALRLQTIQALCNALDCKLSDFCLRRSPERAHPCLAGVVHAGDTITRTQREAHADLHQQVPEDAKWLNLAEPVGTARR